MLFPVCTLRRKSILFLLQAVLGRVCLMLERALLKAEICLAVVAFLAFRKASPRIHKELELLTCFTTFSNVADSTLHGLHFAGLCMGLGSNDKGSYSSSDKFNHILIIII
jgi:hypothetical protein